jgi:chemotaxis signal transduction protein
MIDPSRNDLTADETPDQSPLDGLLEDLLEQWEQSGLLQSRQTAPGAALGADDSSPTNEQTEAAIPAAEEHVPVWDFLPGEESTNLWCLEAPSAAIAAEEEPAEAIAAEPDPGAANEEPTQDEAGAGSIEQILSDAELVRLDLAPPVEEVQATPPVEPDIPIPAAEPAPPRSIPTAEYAPEDRYLKFRLCGQSYALGLASVREAERAPEVTRVPGMPAFLKGAFSHRGEIIPLIDLGDLLALQQEDQGLSGKKIMIVNSPHGPMALAVEELEGLIGIRAADVAPMQAVRKEPDGVIRGVAGTPEHPVLVLDARALYACPGMRMLTGETVESVRV